MNFYNVIPPPLRRQNAFNVHVEYNEGVNDIINELEEVNIEDILYRELNYRDINYSLFPELTIDVKQYPVLPKVKRVLSDSVASPNINAKFPPTLYKFNSF
jgi:hypothetical protein